jgi:hypothetical protein
MSALRQALLSAGEKQKASAGDLTGAAEVKQKRRFARQLPLSCFSAALPTIGRLIVNHDPGRC